MKDLSSEQPTITQSDFEIVVGIRRKKTNVSTSELLRLINGGAVISSIRQLPRTSLAAQDGLVEALEYMLRVFDETNANDYEDVHLMVKQSAKITSIADCRQALSAIKGDKS